jgi:hypothetical protein
MVLIEIPPNANCDEVDLRVFQEVEIPQPVTRVRLERNPNRPEWYEVVGWTLDGLPSQAWAQKVDDSGEGVAILIHGADAGVRLRPAGCQTPWQSDHPEQWGAPFLIMADAEDIQLERRQ